MLEVVYKIFHKINDNKLNAEKMWRWLRHRRLFSKLATTYLNAETLRCRVICVLCISAPLRSLLYFASKIHFSFFRKPRNLVIDIPDLFYTHFIFSAIAFLMVFKSPIRSLPKCSQPSTYKQVPLI